MWVGQAGREQDDRRIRIWGKKRGKKEKRVLFNDQLDAQFLFCIRLFHFSTCFEHSSAHHQEIQLYQYDIWYMSLYVWYAGLDGTSKPAYHT